MPDKIVYPASAGAEAKLIRDAVDSLSSLTDEYPQYEDPIELIKNQIRRRDVKIAFFDFTYKQAKL